MKDTIIAVMDRVLSNPHTTLSGVVWVACKLGAIWLPQYKSQFEATEAVAVGYGLVMAGDSAKSVSKAEADTTFVKKTDPTPPAKTP